MHRGRVLIVDDDAFSRKAMQLYLEAEGFEVAAADGGAEAVARLEEGPYDACVLDILMPRMNGIEVLRAIREKGNDVEVIVVTGCASRDALAEVGRLGSHDYLQKPLVDFESTLLRSVTRAVERKRLRGEIRRLRGVIEHLQARSEIAAEDPARGLAAIGDLIRRLSVLSTPAAILRELCATLRVRLGARAAAAVAEGEVEMIVEPAGEDGRAFEEAFQAARMERAGDIPCTLRAGSELILAVSLGPVGAIAAIAPAESPLLLGDALLAAGAAAECRIARIRQEAEIPLSSR